MIASEKLRLLAAGASDRRPRPPGGSGMQGEDIAQVAGLVIVWLLILVGMLIAG